MPVDTVGTRGWRAAGIGVAAGVVLLIVAREIIIPPKRMAARRAHVPGDCVFRSAAWKAEAGILWNIDDDGAGSARQRMSGDLTTHHIPVGTPRERVEFLLGPPDSIDKGGWWVYRTHWTGGIVVWFTRWNVVSGLGAIHWDFIVPPAVGAGRNVREAPAATASSPPAG